MNLQGEYTIPHNRYCGHEFVLEGHWEDVPDIHALDISKRLMDYGFHPPTNYFPLIVPEALMIEPTETEDKATLDTFIHAMKQIAAEAKSDPELLRMPSQDVAGELSQRGVADLAAAARLLGLRVRAGLVESEGRRRAEGQQRGPRPPRPCHVGHGLPLTA